MNRGTRAAAEIEKQSKAQETAAKAAQVHQKEVEKLRNGLDKLLGSIDPATKGLGRLDELESKLRQSKKAGILDNDTFDDYLGKINNQRAALSTVNSLSEGTKKLTLNTKTSRRELKSFIQQLTSGNFGNAGNALFNLGNTTGLLPPLFTAATLSVGAFIAVTYGIIKVIVSLAAEQERFNRALAATGNYAGTTAGNLAAMSNRIGKINSNYSDTSKVITDLAGKGNLTAKSIENIAAASAYMSAVTGENAQDTIKSFNNIQDSVTKWALESNEQYHWLDLATYQRIATLEEQGNTEEAIAVATGRYASVMEQRAKDMENQLNWLSRGWKNLTNDISDSLDVFSYLSRSALSLSSDDEELSRLENMKAEFEKKVDDLKSNNGSSGWIQLYSRDIEKLQKDIDKLKEKLKPKQDKTRLDNEQQKINDRANDSQKKLSEQWKQNRTETEKQADAVENLRKNYEALWATVKGRESLQKKGVMSEDGKTFSGGQYDKDNKQITDSGLEKYNENLARSIQLEKEHTTLAKVMFDITKGQYKNASKEEKDRAIALAKQIDAQKAANKEKNKKVKDPSLNNDKTNLGLQQQLNQLLYGTKASGEAVGQWYNNLLAQFKKTGNNKGINLIDQLLPLKKAEANLDEIITKIQQQQSKQATTEQTIQAQVVNGVITQIEAQNQLVDVHKKSAEELKQYLPILQQMTTLPGKASEDAQKALVALKLQISGLQQTTDALTNAFKNGLQNGIQSSLEGLARGTFKLNDALLNLVQSIASSMAQIASKGLAEMAMNGLGKLFNSSNEADESDGTDTKIKTSLVEGSTILTTAMDASFAKGAMLISNAAGQTTATTPEIQGTPLVEPVATTPVKGVQDQVSAKASAQASAQMGDAITSAASSGAVSLGTAIATSAATGSNIFSAALNSVFSTAISSIMSAMASSTSSGVAGAAAVMAATGGYISGPGTATSDSIPSMLSNGEYVVNAASVKKYGVDYLHAINTGRLHHYATGGLVSNVTTPNAPKLTNSERNASQNQSSPVIQQTLVVDGGDLIDKGMNTTQGKRSMITFIRANSSTLRQVLGVN
ncbi:phage tail length tape measure family protein [Orbaceae bacterium ESL0721]|nr:phage tail length tape measure family protein [Orbaceae bacterium ESL0721]